MENRTPIRQGGGEPPKRSEPHSDRQNTQDTEVATVHGMRIG